MRLKLVPPRQGAQWLRQGLTIFFRRPFGFCLLFLVYMMIGPVLMFAVAPLATISFMLTTRCALQGRFPLPAVFVEPLQTRVQRWAQLKLCLLYAVGIGVVIWLGDMVGGQAFDALREAVAAGRTAPHELEPLLADPDLQNGWLVLAAGIAALAVPFWHAPALVHWGAEPVAKALFFSTVACWRNKGALIVYMLAWAGVILAFALVSTTLFALLGMPQLAFAMLTPAMLLLSAAFYASLYFTFVDSFEMPEHVPALAAHAP